MRCGTLSEIRDTRFQSSQTILCRPQFAQQLITRNRRFQLFQSFFFRPIKVVDDYCDEEVDDDECADDHVTDEIDPGEGVEFHRFVVDFDPSFQRDDLEKRQNGDA